MSGQRSSPSSFAPAAKFTTGADEQPSHQRNPSVSSRSTSPTSSSPPPTIAEFYAGKTLLVTGALGFLGKTVLEKLLRSCPGITRLYLVIRPSKDLTAKQRLEETLTSDLFDTLKASQPDFRQKITVIEGDITLPNFGIRRRETTADVPPSPSPSLGSLPPSASSVALPSMSMTLPSPSSASLEAGLAAGGAVVDEEYAAEIIEELVRTVSVIINCAATVNFNEKLKVSLATNVTSVRHLIALARKMERLESFLHVSTAYSQSDRLSIEERFYPAVADPAALIEAVSSMSDETAIAITRGLVGARPNTYTLTKSLCEDVIRREGAGLPMAVLRPTIVAARAESPNAGWTDTFNGPAGLYIALSHSMLRVMEGDEEAICDVVPVDFCANMIIAAAWKVGVQQPEQPLIFNCCSGATNPVTWGLHNKYIVSIINANPQEKTYGLGLVMRPNFGHVKNKYQFLVTEFFCHTIPAVLGDACLRLTFQKPLIRRLYAKLGSSTAAYNFFTSTSFKFEATAAKNLLSELTPEDRKEFNFDFTTYKWDDYFRSYWAGCKHLAKTLETKRLAKISAAPTPTPTATPTTKGGPSPLLLLTSAFAVAAATVTVAVFVSPSLGGAGSSALRPHLDHLVSLLPPSLQKR